MKKIILLIILISSVLVTNLFCETELIDQRTFYTKTYRIRNNNFKTIYSAFPVHYKNKNGEFNEIDLQNPVCDSLINLAINQMRKQNGKIQDSLYLPTSLGEYEKQDITGGGVFYWCWQAQTVGKRLEYDGDIHTYRCFIKYNDGITKPCIYGGHFELNPQYVTLNCSRWEDYSIGNVEVWGQHYFSIDWNDPDENDWNSLINPPYEDYQLSSWNTSNEDYSQNFYPGDELYEQFWDLLQYHSENDYLGVAFIADNADTTISLTDRNIILYYEMDLEIYGTVKDVNNNGIGGVTINFSNGAGSTTTNSAGYYHHLVDYGWSGTVTPQKTGYEFMPEYRDYSSVTEPIGEENYLGISLDDNKIYIHPNLGDYNTIQSGINAASDGDTVMVCDGTYTGQFNRNLTWNGNEKHITVMSVNGPDNCIIDGENTNNDGFLFSWSSDFISSEDVINGITIKDFEGSAINSIVGSPSIMNNKIINCNGNSWKAAIKVKDVDNPEVECLILNNTFEDCQIIYNHASNDIEGGAIHCEGYGWISNNEFINCRATGFDDGYTTPEGYGKGGGIWVINNSTQEMIIKDNNFDNCEANKGGAIFADGSGVIIIETNDIHACEAGWGGSIYESCSNIQIINNEIYNCHGVFYLDGTDGFGGEGAGIYVVGPAYIANNTIHDNFGSINGVGISGPSSSGVEIVNNEFYGNEQNGVNNSCFLFGVSIALEGDDIIVSSNKIHNEKSYDFMDMIYVSGYNITVKNNVIYDNTNSDLYSRAAIGCRGSYEFNPDSVNIVNNTILNNEYGIYCFDFSGGDQVKMKNNIIFNNSIGIKEDYGSVANIQFCNVFNNNTDYQGCSPGTGCISTDPMFADPANDDYSLTWSSNNISPCIDAGDPDMTWDADDTPPDIGAKTAVTHSYFTNQFDNGVIDSVEWISFPALNTITNGATEALFVLENQELIDDDWVQTDDILDYLLYEDENNPKIYFDDYYNVWQNDLQPDGNFHSYQGYKMQLRDNNDSIRIGITGIWEDFSEPIQLYANQANWIGCYLEEPASISEAFSSIEDEWISIKSEHWSVHRQINDW
ncbi:MAG: right-handed parallel beta-helix repeat-containing protein, partial [Candidatus Cloacimonetes bacterium]|nr:right-handed parallel beta-helix repeat-containing protein [Candidatus Cloacimonadota bacterium]